ncbi:MAG TPA: hypothetical protein VIG24_02260 [Acidimicrobiia bacterium]
MPYAIEKPDRKEWQQVLSRVNYLQRINDPYLAQRDRVRALMNGGKGAVKVLLSGLETNDNTLPAANHIKSGIERFSEMIAPAPDLKIDPPSGSDNDRAIRAAAKRERIVASYDERCRLEHQLAQASMWLPGYGFYSWKVAAAKDAQGYRYPKAELRDPYTSWPAEWGVDQRPLDIAYQRFVDPDTLVMIYPHAKSALEKIRNGAGRQRLAGGAVDLSPHTGLARRGSPTPGWDGVTGGVEVIEYVDGWGTYVLSPAVDGFLDIYEHPLDRAPIVVPRRFTFDTLTGHFDDVVGLASVMAKLTLLTQIVMEDAAFAPVVVTGRMDGPFRKGQDAVNVIEGGDAKYLTQNIPYQMFTEIDRIEKHLRQTTGYSKQADGESPMSFVTGQGLEELGSSLARQVDRYHLVQKHALEDLDSIRLEWDERAPWRDEERFIEGTRSGESYSEVYTPSKDIGGRWRTRRVYGIMAGLDEARRTVGMLQLLAAEVIDVQTVQENLSHIDNAPKVRDRILTGKIENVLFETLLAMGQQGDPNAMQAITRIRKNPKEMQAVLDEFFDPEDQEEAQQQMEASPEDEFAQVLTRLTAGGESQGGIQTVRELGG